MWAYMYDVGRLAMAVTLLVGGASKLVSPRPLAIGLGQVYGWSRPVGMWAARTVATVELAAALLLAGAWAAVVGLALTALVGTGIVLHATIAIRRGATAPCGCFGESNGRPIGVRNLLAGIALLTAAVMLLVLPAAAGATPAAMGLPLAAVVGLVAVLVRDRARLVAPFRRHFGWRRRSVAAVPLPSGPEVS
jgi:hypothetical protein